HQFAEQVRATAKGLVGELLGADRTPLRTGEPIEDCQLGVGLLEIEDRVDDRRALGHGVRRRNTELLHLRTSHTERSGRASGPAHRSFSVRHVVVGTPWPVVTDGYGAGHILTLTDVTATTVP